MPFAALLALAAVLAPAVVSGNALAVTATPVRYTLDATLDPDTRTIAGSVEILVQNTARVSVGDVALVLYPNRFAVAEPGIDDLNRPYVYPREEFVAGGITLARLEARPADGAVRPLAEQRLEAVAGWPDTLLRARLPAPLAPGDSVLVRAEFRTVLPERYGPFGIADGRVTALGGWFPMLAALHDDGAWDAGTPSRPMTVKGTLRAPRDWTVVLDRATYGPGHDDVIAFSLGAPAWPALLASADYRIQVRERSDGGRIALFELPARHALRLPRPTSHADIVLDAVDRILAARPSTLPAASGALLVVEAPLRLELTAPSGGGVAIVSDRLLRVHQLLRDFHERELATAVYAALLRDSVMACDRPADAPWVTEGIAAALADRYLARARPDARSVDDWIRMLNVFAIVDRFESAPKIPFAHAFFPESRHADELRDGVETFARDRPSGRTIFTKLRNEVGDDVQARAIDRYLTVCDRFREVAATAAGQPLDWLFDEWTAPYPATLDYALDGTELNMDARASPPAAAGDVPATDASVTPRDGAEGERRRHRLTVSRRSSRPVREPVEIELRGRDDRRARLVWDDARERAVFVVDTPWRATRALLDPNRRLLEDTRADNARPPFYQVVLDSADVTVTSSEFAISGLFVARRRYDYTKDLAMVPYFSDRSIGMNVGPRLHFGVPNDPTIYRHNLFAFYTLEGLRRSFHDDSRPQFRTDGRLGGLGLRYDYSDEFAYDNPTAATKLRIFGDWFDHALGSSFDYVDWGVRASAVRPLGTPRTLIALQLMNAFSTPTGSDHVPNQGRYSLGGDLAIRGIPVRERLGENIVLGRLELRQTIYPELDLNLHDVLIIRRGQLRLFVDTGRVEDRRESLYRVSDFAVGVGIGAAAFYDFMGFFPAVAYVAIAQRVDRPDASGVQFLFGTRQAF
jgi:hypothetical protein